MKAGYALSVILMVGYAAIFTLLAQMRTEFGFTETAIGLIAAAAFVAGFIAQIGLARYADRGYGALLMRLGLTCALFGAVWMCFATSLWEWISARIILGFGAGCVRPSLRRLAFVLDPSKAGTTLGKLAAWEMVGFLLGPVLASALFEMAGIRAPFYVLVALLVLVAPFVMTIQVPGSEQTDRSGMLDLLRKPAMQSCIAIGVAFYLAIGVFDAIWAVFMTDRGASQLMIGIMMSAFTLPMIMVAPFAGGYAARRNVLNVMTVTMLMAACAMLSYGFIDSIWWLLVPLGIHATVDAISMPATQLAVGYASGESLLATGQGLFGAVGLVVAAVASIGSGYVYQHYGPEGLWVST